MIQVHLTEIFAEPSVYAGQLGRISMLLGGPPVAPVFMVILGYFLGVTRRSFSGLIVRGGGLLMIAVLLNTGLNFHLLLKIHDGTFRLNPWEYLLGVDILFLASLSIILLAVLRPVFRKYKIASVLAALLVILFSPTITSLLTVNSPSRYALAFVAGNYAWSYFPLFPWLSYPLLGFAFSLFRQKFAAREYHKMMRLIGLFIVASAIAITAKYALGVSSDLETYYHHGPQFLIWIVLFLGFWLTALSLLHKDLGETTLFRYLKWLGKNVLSVYAIQWLIIGNLGTLLYKTQSLPQLMVWYLLVIIAVSAVVFFLLKFADEWKNWRHLASKKAGTL